MAGFNFIYIYINFVFLLGFLYLCDKLYVGYVIGYVTWPIYISFVLSFSSFYFLFPFFLFSIYNSSGMPAITSNYLMCGFLNRAVSLHIMTIMILGR